MPALGPTVTWGEPETADQTSAGSSRPPLIRSNTRVTDAHAVSRSVRSPGRASRPGELVGDARPHGPYELEVLETGTGGAVLRPPRPGAVAVGRFARCAVEDSTVTSDNSCAPACGTRPCPAVVRAVRMRAKSRCRASVPAIHSEQGRRPAGRSVPRGHPASGEAALPARERGPGPGDLARLRQRRKALLPGPRRRREPVSTAMASLGHARPCTRASAPRCGSSACGVRGPRCVRRVTPPRPGPARVPGRWRALPLAPERALRPVWGRGHTADGSLQGVWQVSGGNGAGPAVARGRGNDVRGVSRRSWSRRTTP